MSGVLNIYDGTQWVPVLGFYGTGDSGDNNCDGGSAASTYLPDQNIDGGDANG